MSAYQKAITWLESCQTSSHRMIFCSLPCVLFKIHQRGVQWKLGVVVYTILYAVLLYNATPIHCTPLPLHPPVMNTKQISEIPIRQNGPDLGALNFLMASGGGGKPRCSDRSSRFGRLSNSSLWEQSEVHKQGHVTTGHNVETQDFLAERAYALPSYALPYVALNVYIYIYI